MIFNNNITNNFIQGTPIVEQVSTYVNFMEKINQGKNGFIKFVFRRTGEQLIIGFTPLITYNNTIIKYNSSIQYSIIAGLQLGGIFIVDRDSTNLVTGGSLNTEPTISNPSVLLEYYIMNA